MLKIYNNYVISSLIFLCSLNYYSFGSLNQENNENDKKYVSLNPENRKETNMTFLEVQPLLESSTSEKRSSLPFIALSITEAFDEISDHLENNIKLYVKRIRDHL